MNGSRRIGCRIWVELNPEGKKYSSSGRRSESCTAMEVGGSMHSVKVGGKGSRSFGVISKEPAGGTLPLQHLNICIEKLNLIQFFIHIYRKSKNVKAS